MVTIDTLGCFSWNKRAENEKNQKINWIRSDNGCEFKNDRFSNFCLERGYKCEFFTLRRP